MAFRSPSRESKREHARHGARRRRAVSVSSWRGNANGVNVATESLSLSHLTRRPRLYPFPGLWPMFLRGCLGRGTTLFPGTRANASYRDVTRRRVAANSRAISCSAEDERRDTTICALSSGAPASSPRRHTHANIYRRTPLVPLVVLLSSPFRASSNLASAL